MPEGNPYADFEPTDYFQHHDAAEKTRSGGHIARTAEAIVGRTGSMLELGCGRGELLEGAANQGWTVAGVDMTTAFVAEATSRGVEVEEASVENCRSLDQAWDVILLAAVLEHLYLPMDVLRRVARSLRPGGAVYLDVPNECSLYTRVGNLSMKLRGRDWAINLSPTFPPFHVVGFCPRSLRYALAECGLEVIRMDLYDMTLHVGDRAGLAARTQQLVTSAVLKFGGFCGQGAGITCWARKPGSTS